MKIQCQSCQAKYTIADEKVLGKVVKIRCKKCSATIVINGNDQPHAEEAADTHVFDYAQQGNEQWTVNVADGDQRTMTAQEIVSEYRNGIVNDETYCWKDGMADWLPLREVEQLYGAVKFNTRQSHEDISVQPQSVPPPAAAPLFSASEVAGAVDSPFAGAAAAYAGNGHGNGNGNGGALFAGGGLDAHAAPAAARRGGGRGQGADLFGNVEKAGGEDDVMTSAAAGGGGGGAGAAGAAIEDPKLTGQRNENSVLFSLSALTDDKKAPKENRTTASADGSGLIDIRALSANMDAGENKKDGARVDDIMNLSGGGAFGAALAAPILAPPPLEMADPALMGGGPQKSNKTLIFAILGGCAFIAIAIVVAVVFAMGSGSSTATTATPTATASAATPDPTGTGAVAAADPSATGTATGDTPAAPGTGNNAGAKPGMVNAPPAAAGKGPHHPGAVAAGDGPKPATPAAAPPEAPKDFNSALAAAAGKPKEAAPSGPSGGSSAAFDRGAAAAALGSVNAQSCKRPDGPTGSGHVTVTFGPDGSVQSAVVDSGPFPGSPVGGCIAGKYRGAHVPAFSGAPVRVGKSFTIN